MGLCILVQHRMQQGADVILESHVTMLSSVWYRAFRCWRMLVFGKKYYLQHSDHMYTGNLQAISCQIPLMSKF